MTTEDNESVQLIRPRFRAEETMGIDPPVPAVLRYWQQRCLISAYWNLPLGNDPGEEAVKVGGNQPRATIAALSQR